MAFANTNTQIALLISALVFAMYIVFCLFGLRPYVPVNNFSQSCRDVSWVEAVLSNEDEVSVLLKDTIPHPGEIRLLPNPLYIKQWNSFRYLYKLELNWHVGERHTRNATNITSPAGQYF